MAITKEKNSISDIVMYSPLRCDTHFKHNIILASDFFSNPEIEWVSLGSVLKNIRNGMNVTTDYYSMEETSYHYISVSQIKEYGLVKKNQNYLNENVVDLSNYFEIKDNMLLVTRSGTIGVALSSSHPSFDLEENSYVASGFVITAEMQEGFLSSTIASYINMQPVQRYLIAMSAGACQKNISQPVITNLPIPSVLLKENNKIQTMFDEYEEKSLDILKAIDKKETELEELKKKASKHIIDQIVSEYK